MKEYLIIGGGILLILLTLFLLIRFSNKFRRKSYELFLIAENSLDDEKMEYVVEQIYSYLPSPLRIFPPSFYQRILQKLFDEIHDLLEN